MGRNNPPGGAPPKHGGSAAVRDLAAGKSFTGMAAREERAVRDQLEAEGLLPMLETQLCRQMAAANLFWNAGQADLERGDLKAFTLHMDKMGWLSGASVRTAMQVHALRKKQPPAMLLAALAAAREVNGEQ